MIQLDMYLIIEGGWCREMAEADVKLNNANLTSTTVADGVSSLSCSKREFHKGALVKTHAQGVSAVDPFVR